MWPGTVPRGTGAWLGLTWATTLVTSRNTPPAGMTHTHTHTKTLSSRHLQPQLNTCSTSSQPPAIPSTPTKPPGSKLVRSDTPPYKTPPAAPPTCRAPLPRSTSVCYHGVTPHPRATIPYTSTVSQHDTRRADLNSGGPGWLVIARNMYITTTTFIFLPHYFDTSTAS